jgi:hypothetical protein
MTGNLDVQGTVTADGLTVDGLAEISASNTRLNLYETDTTDKNTQLQSSNSRLMIKTLSDDGSATTERLRVDHTTGDISFYEDTGTTAKFFWDASAESLGIGTTSPDAGNDIHIKPSSGNAVFALEGNAAEWWKIIGGTDDKLYFQNETDSNVMVISDGSVGIGTTSPAAPLEVDGGSDIAFFTGTNVRLKIQNPSTGVLQLNSAGAGDSLSFATVDTERMRINSSGNVGIGYTTPSEKLGVNGFLGVVGTHTSPPSANPSISRVDQNNAMGFFNNSTERMRIDSSGNLLVGKTASSASTTGAELQSGSGGQSALIATAAGTKVGVINRTTSDGDIVEFRKDGATVGSIGVTSTQRLTIGSSVDTDVGLVFQPDTDKRIYPVGDDVVELGRTGHRFKDLMLSGGVFLGGTGSANKLDDYEQGTFTPTIFGTTTGGTGTYSIQRGGYIKIGNLVYAQIYIGWTAHTGTGNMRLSGLPFTAETTTPYGYGAPNMSYASGLSFNYNQLGGYVSGNTNILVFNTFESVNLTSVSMDGTVAELLFNLHYIAQ